MQPHETCKICGALYLIMGYIADYLNHYDGMCEACSRAQDASASKHNSETYLEQIKKRKQYFGEN